MYVNVIIERWSNRLSIYICHYAIHTWKMTQTPDEDKTLPKRGYLYMPFKVFNLTTPYTRLDIAEIVKSQENRKYGRR